MLTTRTTCSDEIFYFILYVIKNSLSFRGKVFRVWELQKIRTDFEKKSLYIEEIEEQYPNQIGIDFVWDKVSLLDGIIEWDVVTVAFNTRVFETKNGGRFCSINWWKITKDHSSSDLPKTIDQDVEEIDRFEYPF